MIFHSDVTLREGKHHEITNKSHENHPEIHSLRSEALNRLQRLLPIVATKQKGLHQKCGVHGLKVGICGWVVVSTLILLVSWDYSFPIYGKIKMFQTTNRVGICGNMWE